MSSSGDPTKAQTAKKTLVHAFIGLAIVMGANVILNSIRIATMGADGSFATNCAEQQCVDPNTMVTSIIQWVVAMGGVVAVIFVIYGGIGIMTSAGDPAKFQKSKQALTYALIGLVIVALAEIITAFVSNMIRESISQTNQTTISKEVYEKEIG